jgi:hypothetical protein
MPCPNGPGRIEVNTRRLVEGTQPLVVNAQDPASNIGSSPAVTARVDNTPPARVDVTLEGGQVWRNTNDFAVNWSNPTEPDRAPIAAASYRLCPATQENCSRGEQTGHDLSRFSVAAPAPGEWMLSLWRRDAAANETDVAASVPVMLRYDPEPPQVAFEPPGATDPTLVAVQATDTVSGVAEGTIEISATGSGVWQSLATQRDGSRFFARVDDAALPAGDYLLRARAVDQANNEASTDRRLDGQPMALTLPLRIASRMKVGFVRNRKRRGMLKPSATMRAGTKAIIDGRLTNRDNHGIVRAEVHVLSSSAISTEQLVSVLHTDGEGRYRYTAAADNNRMLRFVHPGSPLVLPVQTTVTLRVPALTSLAVSRRRVLNGQAVTFTGRLRTLPAPAPGKLVELQARLSDRWQTFRTTRTDAAGRWSVPYRFKRTRGVQRYRFRARLPHEANYPFVAGGSRRLTVQVRGL